MKETKLNGQGSGKSERPILPMRAGNPNPRRPEGGKGSAQIKELLGGKMNGTSSPINILTKCQRIAEISRKAPNMAWTTLAHNMDIEWLEEAYRQTRKDGAVGIDGKGWEEYGKDLQTNLRKLLYAAKSGTYYAPPVKRIYIPKGEGKEVRPLGIPTLEDKVLQKGVVMLLESVYEQDFLDCSYGFRPKRSAHDAIRQFHRTMMSMRGGWVIRIDIQKYFDTVNHAKIREILGERIRDGALTRLIGKWLKAGVLENGQRYYPDTGTPQGGVISPLLANIYLHKALDQWIEREIKPLMKGRTQLIRYADDALICFANEMDARRVMDVLSKRFEKYGLKLHPDKTLITRFQPRQEKRETIDFLGFTHYWGKAQKGYWVMKHKTKGKRLKAALKRINQWMKANRHQKIRRQHETLKMKLKGHYNYYGISSNSDSLASFYYQVQRLWLKWLGRRSQRAKRSWEWFRQLLKRYPLPPPRIRVCIYAT